MKWKGYLINLEVKVKRAFLHKLKVLDFFVYHCIFAWLYLLCMLYIAVLQIENCVFSFLNFLRVLFPEHAIKTTVNVGHAWTVVLKILLFNKQLSEITKCRHTGAPALYSAVHGKYWMKTRPCASLWGTFYITVLLLDLKNAHSGRCGRKLEDFLFCLCVFFASSLFLKHCIWLKGCCLTSCVSRDASAGL